jgi:hypothetical protein
MADSILPGTRVLIEKKLFIVVRKAKDSIFPSYWIAEDTGSGGGPLRKVKATLVADGFRALRGEEYRARKGDEPT